MAGKRTHTRGRHRAQPPSGSRSRQWALLLSVVLMVGGLLLIGGAGLGLVIRGTPDQQAMAGALLLVLGFAASNGIQGHLMLAGGWGLLGSAALVWLLSPAPVNRTAGIGLACAGLTVLAWQFARRLNKTLSEPKR